MSILCNSFGLFIQVKLSILTVFCSKHMMNRITVIYSRHEISTSPLTKDQTTLQFYCDVIGVLHQPTSHSEKIGPDSSLVRFLKVSHHSKNPSDHTQLNELLTPQ